MSKKSGNNLQLQLERENLTKEYLKLEEERKNAETVITCQTRKKEIEQRVFKIEEELLEESEGYRESSVSKNKK